MHATLRKGLFWILLLCGAGMFAAASDSPGGVGPEMIDGLLAMANAPQPPQG